MKQIIVPEEKKVETVYIVKAEFNYYDTNTHLFETGSLCSLISDNFSGIDLANIIAYRRYFEYYGSVNNCGHVTCYPLAGTVELIEQFPIDSNSNPATTQLTTLMEKIDLNQNYTDHSIIFFDEEHLVEVYTIMAQFKTVQYHNGTV